MDYPIRDKQEAIALFLVTAAGVAGAVTGPRIFIDSGIHFKYSRFIGASEFLFLKKIRISAGSNFNQTL